jgi:hypothetical protein
MRRNRTWPGDKKTSAIHCMLMILTQLDWRVKSAVLLPTVYSFKNFQSAKTIYVCMPLQTLQSKLNIMSLHIIYVNS